MPKKCREPYFAVTLTEQKFSGSEDIRSKLFPKLGIKVINDFVQAWIFWVYSKLTHHKLKPVWF